MPNVHQLGKIIDTWQVSHKYQVRITNMKYIVGLSADNRNINGHSLVLKCSLHQPSSVGHSKQ